MNIIPFSADELLDWKELGEAFRLGHTMQKAEINDTFLYRGDDTLLSRAAWIDGLGSLVKSVTVYPENPVGGLPIIHGSVSLFDDETGQLAAIIDCDLVTKWKTAGDSAFAASILARPDSQTILILGAGIVAQNLRRAYGRYFPNAQFKVWNRTASVAKRFAEAFPNTEVVTDLEAAVKWADIVSSATMATEPILRGEWLRQGQHIDLIGAFRPDMREADDAALQRARIFVDSRDTTLDHIGELKIPLETGAITRDDVLAEYYDIASGQFQRTSDDEITLFKNGGGAHLDLMTSIYILRCWQEHQRKA